MYKEIKYFKGLNALRFFAAYSVVLHHAEQIRMKNGLFHLKDWSFFNNGGLAVSFFFVLSGFLISYLLLREKQERGDVSIKMFYVRRILRIWPLYFLLVVIGTLLVPLFIQLINHPYEMPYTFWEVILYYIFFSPFMVNVLFGHHLLEPLWSIGVEEVFYILWAPLFKFFKKNLLAVIVGVIAVKVALLVLISQVEWPVAVETVIRMLEFESMAIGGLGAYLVYHSKKALESRFLFSKPMQLLVLFYVLARLLAGKFLSEHFLLFDYLYNTIFVSKLLLTCCYALLIVNISVNTQSLLRLDNKILDYLGGISYGIYMYHMLVVFGLVLVFQKQFLVLSSVAATVLFYLVLTVVLILISHLSQRYFERYFLRLKQKFRASADQSAAKETPS